MVAKILTILAVVLLIWAYARAQEQPAYTEQGEYFSYRAPSPYEPDYKTEPRPSPCN